MEFLLSDVLKSWNNIWNFKEGINCCNLKFCNMPLVREIGHSRLGKIVSWNCRWLLHPVDTTCWASCLPLQILLILKKCLKLYFPPFLNSYSITKESIWSGCWVVCCSYQCSVIPNKCSNLVEKEERCKSACDYDHEIIDVFGMLVWEWGQKILWSTQTVVVSKLKQQHWCKGLVSWHLSGRSSCQVYQYQWQEGYEE